ncbi:MAG: DJ-1/PfpI family protein [bacterium]|nr:DJ-1/PfpI family protein [bacterium]
MKKVLFIVANIGFQDDEFGIPFEILQKEGYRCDVASGLGGKCRGVFMRSIEKSLKIAEVRAEEYDMLVFVGGGGAYDQYYQELEYLALSKNAKAVAAICIAPALLSDAGIYQGKQVTGRDDGQGTQIAYLQKNGASYLDQDVVRDGHLITANGPAAAPKFAWAIVDYLCEA